MRPWPWRRFSHGDGHQAGGPKSVAEPCQPAGSRRDSSSAPYRSCLGIHPAPGRPPVANCTVRSVRILAGKWRDALPDRKRFFALHEI